MLFYNLKRHYDFLSQSSINLSLTPNIFQATLINFKYQLILSSFRIAFSNMPLKKLPYKIKNDLQYLKI